VGALWFLSSRPRKPAAPKPKPTERDIGDIVKHNQSGLPIVLLEQLTHDKFRGCFITPHAQALGAAVGGGDKKPVDELDDILVSRVQEVEIWPDYTHKLSDGEHANYAKAMLAVKGNEP
jgi:hypothetical protein